MHFSLVKILSRTALICVVIFVATSVFNGFCNSSNQCQPFYFSRYFPRFEGDEQIKVKLEVNNQVLGLEFSVEGEKEFNTVSGRLNETTYVVKNTSNKKISFQPYFDVDPVDLEDQIKRAFCLCGTKYKLDPGKRVKLKSGFVVDEDIFEKMELVKKETGESVESVKIIYTVGQ